MGEAFASAHTAPVYVAEGVPITGNGSAYLLKMGMAACKKADQIVLMLGIGNKQEHEGGDRQDTLLPPHQVAFALQVLALGKPTTLVLVNGGILSIDDLKGQAHAIVEAFYPSTRGGEALYMQLSGPSFRAGENKRPKGATGCGFIEFVGVSTRARPPGGASHVQMSKGNRIGSRSRMLEHVFVQGRHEQPVGQAARHHLPKGLHQARRPLQL